MTDTIRQKQSPSTDMQETDAAEKPSEPQAFAAIEMLAHDAEDGSHPVNLTLIAT